MNAYQEVERLSESVRAGNYVALDEILVKCRAWMAADVASEGHALGLSSSRAKMFDLLLSRRGRVVTRDALFDACHQGGSDTLTKVIDVQMVWIRKKLKGTKYEGKLKTFRGEGYCLAN
jgi:DNA-binding response OmpR family regulator